jgi:hypothetical protein
MEIWELVAREQIRETLHSYNWHGDHGRPADLAAQFTEDGILETRPAGRGGTGRQGIIEFIEGGTRRPIAPNTPRGQRPLVRHHLSNILFLEVTPERASVVSYFLRMHRNWPEHWGVYRDVLVPAEGRWLIKHRVVSTDGEMWAVPQPRVFAE